MHREEKLGIGVFVTDFHDSDNHRFAGNYMFEKGVKFLKEVLAQVEIDPRRLRLKWVLSSEGGKSTQIVNETTWKIKIFESTLLGKKFQENVLA